MSRYYVIRRPIEASISCVALALMLGGCGMKGPLYHPQPAAQPEAPAASDAQSPARHAPPTTETTPTDHS